MKEQERIISLFPTFVMSNRLDRDITTDELNCILDYNDKLNETTEGITSREQTVLENERLSGLKSFCEEILNDYFIKIYNPINPDDVALKITESWLNFTIGNKFHEKHKHYNSFMSGILYINAYRDKDSIVFTKADSDFNWQIHPKEPSEFNSTNFHLSVGTGDIIIFPSNLYHITPVTNNNYLRISLAFSSYIVGTIGFIEGPLKGINQLTIKL